ncbi:hypothetical protein [Coleofasciculus sp. F4-SAH-05]|uniref:hypothetical protein n=1 Tax=Coleofasciculus sp. F4-SAH-05 TaxID=3069525 RepID=UPI0032FB3140
MIFVLYHTRSRKEASYVIRHSSFVDFPISLISLISPISQTRHGTSLHCSPSFPASPAA